MNIHTRTSDYTQTTSYLHRDHLGSISAITNEDGDVIAQMSFGAFGQRRDPTDWSGPATNPTPDTTDRGYTGHKMLDDVGLIHMNGRVYDPGLGRFISADPIIQAPFNSQSFNRYSYVWNNPLSFVDPSGFVVNWDDDTTHLGTITVTGTYYEHDPTFRMWWDFMFRAMTRTWGSSSSSSTYRFETARTVITVTTRLTGFEPPEPVELLRDNLEAALQEARLSFKNQQLRIQAIKMMYLGSLRPRAPSSPVGVTLQFARRSRGIAYRQYPADTGGVDLGNMANWGGWPDVANPFYGWGDYIHFEASVSATAAYGSGVNGEVGFGLDGVSGMILNVKGVGSDVNASLALTVGKSPRGFITAGYLQGGRIGHFGIMVGHGMDSGWFVQVSVGFGLGAEGGFVNGYAY